jgi:hypothetical protein
MITVEKGKVILKGTPMHLCIEATTALEEVYKFIKENTDKDFADAVLSAHISHLKEFTGANIMSIDPTEKSTDDLHKNRMENAAELANKILEDFFKND